jgi:type I restriction enzyme, R subunit
VSQALDKDGTVRVLRRGVEDQGLTIRLMYSRPASGMNASLAELYGKNRLTVTRQLHYSTANNNSLDLCLFVNGIPVATAELKNPLNGQSVTDAINQYKKDSATPRSCCSAGGRWCTSLSILTWRT